jgi:hypothetical protein
MRTYPTSTSNRNVPASALLIAETEATSGECVTTYYADAHMVLWKVGDWVGDKPEPAFMFEVCRLTGDTEMMVAHRWAKHFPI